MDDKRPKFVGKERRVVRFPSEETDMDYIKRMLGEISDDVKVVKTNQVIMHRTMEKELKPVVTKLKPLASIFSCISTVSEFMVSMSKPAMWVIGFSAALVAVLTYFKV